MKGRVRPEPTLYLLIAGLTAGVFLIDIIVGIGVAVWVLYCAPVILSLQSARPEVPLGVGFVACLLVLVGYYISGPTTMNIELVAPVNRFLVIVILILLGIVGKKFVEASLFVVREDWIKEGLGEISGAMLGNPTPEELAQKSLDALCDYLGALVGCLYVRRDDGSLGLTAGFARPLCANGAKEVVQGEENLVGQAAAGKSVIVVEDLPDDYLPIQSGLGETRPQVLALVPLLAGDEVVGVMELGFLRSLSPADRLLLETAAEPIGISLRAAIFQERQKELLEETQRQAAELLLQQQELRAANEELEEHSQALRESQSHLEEQRAQLEEVNAGLESQTMALEQQKEAMLATQELLRHKAAELERASQYKSQFLANMSHELRTPLNSALILARLLADNPEGNLTQEQVKYATNIYQAGNDLLALINDILDLAKIEAGKTELTIEDVTLLPFVDELVRRFEPEAKLKGLSLSLRVEDGLPDTIPTDAKRLRQVLVNLVGNAIKFTEAGRVEIAVARAGRHFLEFSVEDTGIGIAEDQQEAIFDAFRQADGGMNRRHGGTGLGLAISRELAVLLGGEIRVRSVPNEGSRFSLLHPLAESRAHGVGKTGGESFSPPPASARPNPRPESVVDDDRLRLDQDARAVLVIEDDEAFSCILRDLANELGFKCLIARTGTEGLALAQEFRPVAIILDIGLPDHSGLTILELLKRTPEVRHVPIHVISVHDYEQVAREMGVVGYALKPVKREQLVDAFRTLGHHIEKRVRKLLLLEDDSRQRDAIAALLKSEGVEIVSVASAEEALERLRETTFDCMVLDLMLPGADGFELLSRMGEEGASHPPVIVYTARALTEEEETRLRKHAKSIIVKGARSPERLLEEVTLFLHQVEAELPPEKRRMLQKVRHREAAFEGRRILVVEDDVRNLYAMTGILEPKGALVEVARNGKEALARMQQEPPVDLVLMDIMMPEMDGISATKEIRKNPQWAELPIIALTAKAMPDDRQECLDAGANDYIAKPIDVEKLLSMVRIWMPR